MSEPLRGAFVIGQSGGPTSVINASTYGAVRKAMESSYITAVYGAAHGIRGILTEQLFDLTQEDPMELAKLPYTPAAALGSCRYKMADFEDDDADYQTLLEVFRKYNIRYFCYNGGNDSMDTCHKVSEYLARAGYECRVMGIPKTIDNDLCETDHCPGFGSAAKYIATSALELSRDGRVYDNGQIVLMECMGRRAGWLTAAAALANTVEPAVDFVYLPERAFDMDRFMEDVMQRYQDNKFCLAAISEGCRFADGRFVFESTIVGEDSFGHVQLGGLATLLAHKIKEATGAKIRAIELSLLQRGASHLASQTDIEEAMMAGQAAVEAMLAGETGKMVGFVCERKEGIYRCETKLFGLDRVANEEKLVPVEWINAAGNGVTEEYIHYALPLIQGKTEQKEAGGLPVFAQLKKIRVSMGTVEGITEVGAAAVLESRNRR